MSFIPLLLILGYCSLLPLASLSVLEFPNVLKPMASVLSYLLFFSNPEDLLKGFHGIIAAHRILLHVTNMVIRGLEGDGGEDNGGRVMEGRVMEEGDGGRVMEEG